MSERWEFGTVVKDRGTNGKALVAMVILDSGPREWVKMISLAGNIPVTQERYYGRDKVWGWPNDDSDRGRGWWTVVSEP